MEEVPKHTRLLRRNGVYYHRAKVPKDLFNTYGKREETFSLGTSDYREACRLVRIKAAEVDRKFDAHRRSISLSLSPPLNDLTDSQLKIASALYHQFLLEEDQEYRLEGFYEGRQLEEPRETFEESGEGRDINDAGDRKNQARGKLTEFYIGEAHEVASWDGLGFRIAKDSASERKLARVLQEVTIRARDDFRKRDVGDIVETPKAISVKAPSNSPLLSVAVAEWVTEKSRTAWADKTREEKEARIRQFINVVGNKPIDQYSKEDARKFKQVLLSIPANWTKCHQFKGLSMAEAATIARAQGMQGMKDNTVKKAMNSVSAFWNWAEANYDCVEKNPLRGMNIRTETSAREERDSFSNQDLSKMFKSPIYTGCHSVRNWKAVGSLIPRDSAIYWVPLLGLFTGARMGEILQLYIADIKTEGDINYFDITDMGEDQKIKNSPSIRKVPIHHELIRWGFLEFVQRQRTKGHKRLFPEVKAGSDGYYSSTFSKHFNRFLKEYRLKTPKTSFHSFRHNFKDACRNSGLSSDLRDALQGHSERGMGARYGDGYSLVVLNEAMQRVRFEGLVIQSDKL